MEQDATCYPFQDDGINSDNATEHLEQPEVILDTDANDTVQRKSQRTSRPPLRVTYDTLGQSSLQPGTTTGVQGISVSPPRAVMATLHHTMDVMPTLQPYS